MRYLLVLIFISMTNLSNANLGIDKYLPDIDSDIKECDVIFIGKVDTFSYTTWTMCGSHKITNFIVFKSYKGLFDNTNYISIGTPTCQYDNFQFFHFCLLQ